MKRNHSRGIWRTGDGFGEITTSVPGILEGSKCICRISTFSKTQVEIEANAKLIAAAPEMLDALTSAMKIVDLWTLGGVVAEEHKDEAIALNSMKELFESAIKKATE